MLGMSIIPFLSHTHARTHARTHVLVPVLPPPPPWLELLLPPPLEASRGMIILCGVAIWALPKKRNAADAFSRNSRL